MPRTARDIVLDLHALLHATRTLRGADIRGTYVLAGHSLGGMLMRLYATYPREVAGLISIDAQSEWFAAAFKRLLTRAQYTSYVVSFRASPGSRMYAFMTSAFRPDVSRAASYFGFGGSGAPKPRRGPR